MRVRVCFALLACLLVFRTQDLWAQNAAPSVLSGTVVDSVTAQPLAGATVFIAGSMMGTVADAEGRFSILDVPAGAHRLYVSMLGYEPVRKELRVQNGRPLTFSFRLKPDVVEMAEVVVSERENRRWRKRLKKFSDFFIGETPNSGLVEIENTHVLDFETKRGAFIARASAPLVITNRALGYRIRFFLKEFEAKGTRIRYDGEPLFEPLEPKDAAEEALWNENRKRAFRGSFRHFMLSVLADSADEAGFVTYGRHAVGRDVWSNDKFPMPTSYILKGERTAPEVGLDFHGVVEIVYRHEGEDPSFVDWMSIGRRSEDVQTSWIQLTDGATSVDQTGEVLDPYGVTLFGYFAFERIADQVPKEYRPE